MGEDKGNGSTALVSPEIHAAVELAMSAVKQFVDSDAARDKMVWMLAMQVNGNEYLQKCTPKSFELAIYEMFKLNLDPRNKNEAWLIPRKDNGVWKANFQPGYAGLRKLALNDPRVDLIFADIVYEEDAYDTDPQTRAPLHRYNHFGKRGPVIGYYGAIRYASGMWATEEMSLADMRVWKNHHSKAADAAVWKEIRDKEGLKRCPFDTMALKTMITAMCSTRHCSLPPEAQAAIAREDVSYGRNVTPVSTYVPTNGEHQQNLDDVWPDTREERPVPDMTQAPPAKADPGPAEKPAAQTREERQFLAKGMALARQAAAAAGLGVAPFLDEIQRRRGPSWDRDHMSASEFAGFEREVQGLVDEHSEPEVEASEGEAGTPYAAIIAWVQKEAETPALQSLLDEASPSWRTDIEGVRDGEVEAWIDWARKVVQPQALTPAG